MRRLAFFTRIIFIGVLFHIYVGIRLIPDAPVNEWIRWCAVLVLVSSCFLIPLGVSARALEHHPLSGVVAWVGLIMLGFFSSLLVLTFARDVILLLILVVSYLGGYGPLENFPAYSAVAVSLLAGFTTAVGLYNARRRAPVKRVNVPIANLPDSLHGFTIVQISDVHVGPTIKHNYVKKIVDAVNALKPDLIAVTGDVVDGSVEQLANHTAALGALAAPHGAFLVLGNHEYYSGADRWIAEFSRIGLKVLVNEHVIINHNGAMAIIAGVTDYSAVGFNPEQKSDPELALKGAPPEIALRVLLAHQPRSAFAASEVGFTLQLSGHTHGGQFLPWNFFVRLQQPFVAGLKKINGLWVYTSRGTGYWGPPKRLGAKSEITELTLVCQR